MSRQMKVVATSLQDGDDLLFSLATKGWFGQKVSGVRYTLSQELVLEFPFDLTQEDVNLLCEMKGVIVAEISFDPPVEVLEPNELIEAILGEPTQLESYTRSLN